MRQVAWSAVQVDAGAAVVGADLAEVDDGWRHRRRVRAGSAGVDMRRGRAVGAVAGSGAFHRFSP